LDHPSAEHHVPEPWFSGSDISTTNSTARALKKLLIVKALRPDRLIYSISHFAAFVLGDEISGQSQIDLLHFVNNSVNSKSPLLLVSAPGYDASYKIELLAK
jgi:dynein heavy chain 1